MTTIYNPVFSSGYASRLYDFIEAKRLCGYKYNGEAKELQRFDRFCTENNISPGDYSEDNIYRWLSKRPNESDKTFTTRNSVYAQFYKHLSIDEDFVLPKPPNCHMKFRKSGFVPYIFTHEQVADLFSAVDNEGTSNGVFNQCAPLLFRILYGTGVRINEALSLKAGDVELDKGYFIIRDAKFDNSRIVPMSESLLKRLDDYVSLYGYNDNDFLFQNGKNEKSINKSTAYNWFRLILFRAGIPHKGRGKGPRLHDLRHTFAVHSLQAAIARGMDPNAFLPILCTYLGHRRLSATEQYLRLTAEVYPSVLAAMDEVMLPIIPEVEDYER